MRRSGGGSREEWTQDGGGRALEEMEESKGAKEGGEEVRKLVWDRGKSITKWVEEEARRRVGALEVRGAAERGRSRDGGK